jgi:multimeric flavodoxin WrbA
MASLLVVHHSPTRGVRALTDAVLAGTADEAIEGVGVVARSALDATADDVNGSDAVLLGTTANFGYMSGALKHFFDSTFLAVGGALGQDGSGRPASGGRKPYALWVHGRYDTAGAVRSVQSIVRALPWTQAAPTLEVLGEVTEEHTAAAYELGATVAALLMD